MMKFQFNDLDLELDDAAQVRETTDGYLVAMPKVARTGIQLYRGSEVGVKDKAIVRIYRPPEEVFNVDSLASYAGKPMTDNHPPKMVDASNWLQYSRGMVGNDIARDGEVVRVPMIMMDRGLINKFKAGKKQISMGYTCALDMTPGTTADGEMYDGVQREIRINHGAIVDAARAGPSFAFGDAKVFDKITEAVDKGLAAIREGRVVRDKALEDGDYGLRDGEYPFMKDGSVYLSALTDAMGKVGKDSATAFAIGYLLDAINDGKPTEKPAMKTMIVDGITVQVGDGNDGEIIQRHIKTLGDTAASLQSQLDAANATHKTVVSTKDAEIAKLTTDLSTVTAKAATFESQLKDAELTPAKLDALVKDRQLVADKAKALLPTVVVDGKSIDEVMKQVVDAKIGDAAKDWKPEQVKVSFDTLAASVKVGTGAARVVGDAFSGKPSSHGTNGGNEALYQKRDKDLQDAWKNPNGVAATH